MSMMSCQADQGVRCCCHGKFIRTGMRIFVWKTVEGLSLADSDIPRVFKHTHLGVTLASNLRWDDHIDRLGGKVAGYVHLCRILAFCNNMH